MTKKSAKRVSKKLQSRKKKLPAAFAKKAKAEFLNQLKANGGDRTAAINASLNLVPFSGEMSATQHAKRMALADLLYKLGDTVSFPLPKHVEMRAKFLEETHHPGKFEGEPAYTPYFYEMMMNGVGEQTSSGDDRFRVSAEDRDIFPELKGKKSVTIHIRDDGFVIAR
jgi:hypothetical protein